MKNNCLIKIVIVSVIIMVTVNCNGYAINAFEYVERFMANWDVMRYEFFPEDDSEFNVDFSNYGVIDGAIFDDKGFCSCTGGLLTFDKNMDVKLISIPFYRSEDTMDTDYVKLTTMITVLEYSQSEQIMMDSLRKGGLPDNNIYRESSDIVGDIWNKVDNDHLLDKANGGEKYLVYSGKSFDYYILQDVKDNSGKVTQQNTYGLVAVAK